MQGERSINSRHIGFSHFYRLFLMWPFGKKQTLEESGLFRGFADWHSHILPGVDDGVLTMAEALQILAEYERLGVKEVWLTPHIMEDMPNTTGHLRERFAELQAAYNGNVNLHLASENMLDKLFEERLEQNDLLPLCEDGKHLLVETSYFNPPMGLQNILLRIKAKGYHPVLAHPERYLYMDIEYYEKLKSMGVKFQLNLFSVYGLYGKEVLKNAYKLQKAGMYEYSGTDLHGLEALKTMLQRKISHCDNRTLSISPQCQKINGKYFKNINMDDLSIFEKSVFHLMNGIDKVNTEIRNRTGFDCIKKMGESEIKDKNLNSATLL